jgi:hypothetical protein
MCNERCATRDVQRDPPQPWLPLKLPARFRVDTLLYAVLQLPLLKESGDLDYEIDTAHHTQTRSPYHSVLRVGSASVLSVLFDHRRNGRLDPRVLESELHKSSDF